MLRVLAISLIAVGTACRVPATTATPREAEPLETDFHVETRTVSGEPPAQVAAAIEPLRNQLRMCLPGTRGVLNIVIGKSDDGSTLVTIGPGASVDPTARHCVLEALSSINLEETGSNYGGTSLKPSGFTSLVTLSW